MMSRYRKKPVVIEAIQYTGDKLNIAAILRLSNSFGITPKGILIKTLEGNMIASIGDWIIQGIQGEFYPCKPNIFEATYEEV